MRGDNFYTINLWVHARPSLSTKSSFKIKGHNFCKVPIKVSINQVKKTSKGGGLGSYQATIDTNMLNTQIRACTCPMGYCPL